MFEEMRLTSRQQLAIAMAFCVAHLLLRSVATGCRSMDCGSVACCYCRAVSGPRWPHQMSWQWVPGAYVCFDPYGVTGSLLHVFPVSAFAMLLVRSLRTQLPGFAFGKCGFELITARHIVVLLGCIFVFALLSSADSTVQIILTLQPQDDPSVIGLWAARLFLGSYLGCLILVPSALAIHEAIRRADSWLGLVLRISRSRLLFEGIVPGLACVGLLTVMGVSVKDDIWPHIVLFLPVVWMAARYDWRGAAASGGGASVGIMLTMPAQYDPATIAAQSFMAVFLTALLLGAKISWLHTQGRLVVDHRQVQQAARREIYQGELRLRRGMQMQGQAYEGIEKGYSHLLERVRDMLPETSCMPFVPC